MKDLEIRGAGDILGGEQSGFINEIGFDAYQKILAEAIDELKENEFKELYEEVEGHQEKVFLKDTHLDTDFELLYPDDYINNGTERLNLYTELNTIKDEKGLENYEAQQQELRDRIVDAQNLLPNVQLDYDLRVKISEVCSQLDVDGLRGDIVTNRAAKASAAYNERSKVTVDDIEKVIPLRLRHRLRKDPLESIDSGDKVSSVFEEVFK